MGGVSQVTPTPADPFAALGGQFESALPPPPTPAKAGTLPGQPPPPRDPFAALGATFEGPPAAAQPAPAPPQAAPGSITEAGRTAYTKQFERGGPYAGGAMPPAPLVGRPDTAQRADSLVATLRAPAPPHVPPDVARLQQANQAVAQGLAQHAATQATVEAAPEQGYLARVGTELRNSALGHAIQTEFPNAPSWMKPTDVAGTAGYRENQGAVPDLLPKWAEAPLVQMNEQGEPLTPQGQAMAKQWTTFKAQHPSIAAVLDPVGAEGEWEKNSPNFAAAHEAFKEFTQSMTSPVQFGLMATGIFGQLGKLNDILGGIFAVQMAHGTYQSAKAAEEAYKKGDNPAAVKAATTAILNAAMLGSVAHHGLAGEEAPAAGAERETPVKAGKAAAPAPAQADPFAELGATFEEPTARTSPRASGNVPRGTSAPEALHPPIGQTEPETGRPVLQQSPRPEVNQAAATAEHPAVKDQLEAAVEPIKGAEVTGARDEKDEERLGEKMEAEGQSPRTVRDYSGFRIAVDSPEARDQTVAALRKQFEIPNESDEFEAGNDETGFHGHTLQVREPGSPVTHEVQVLPREVAENADERHNLYEKAREGDQNAAAEMKRLNQQDYQQFTDRQRGGRGTTPEQAAVEPKFKFGSTQANIPAGSEAAGALKTAREQIAPADRAGDVNDAKGGLVEQPHVTLRYGIQGGDTAGIRRFIESQAPFEASLGKTDSVPPSEHSDGAAAIVAPVEAPELHRIEKEIEGHGDFAARRFPQYKPHATLGYVKPEAAAKYTGMDETAGKKFLVRSIAITDRDGNVEEVPLRGQPAGMPALESSAGERARPWNQAWEKQQREEGLHAVRERGAGEVRQRPPEEAGGAGDGRGRVEPGLEGREAAGAGTLFGGEEEAAAQRTGQSLKPPVPPSERAPAKAWQKGDRFLVRDPATGGWKAGEVTYWNEGVNGAKPGGRSRIGNAKLDEVPHDALPIKPVGGKIEPISGHPDEKETIARVEADEPAYLARYIENPANNKGGVLTIATDAAKEMFPEFKADPTGNDRNVAAAAGRVNKGVLKTALSEPVDPKRPEVQIATASPGSGKTATNSAEANAKIGLKVEHIMDDARGSRKLLQNIIDSGRKPVVNWIYVDDIGATVDRMFRRAIGHDEKPGIGRTVQLNYMIDAYHQLPRVLREMKDEFGDKVVWIATDNSGPKGTARDVDFDRTVDKAAEESYNQIRDTVHEKVNELRREGLFDSERGQAALRAAETTDRPDAQNPGSGRAGTGSGAGPEQAVPGQPGLRSPVLSSTKGPPGPVAETAAPSKGGGSLSPEEFKAGLDQARKGSLRDNAAAQQPKVIDTPEGGRHLPRAVVMDPDTYATWHRAGLGEKTAWRGLSLPRGLANKAEVVLRALAGSARSGTGGAEAAAGYDRLVEAIRKGRNDDGTVTLLRGDYRPDTVLEEAWHGWERANRAAESDAIRSIAERPEVKWAADRLREMGYGGKPGIEGRTEIALEMMAKTLSGDPDLRMTPEQRYDLAHEFLSTAVRESGPEVLKEIPGVTPEAEAALADARRSYEAEPNEGGRGRAARGAGPGANEGAAGRPGVEGRALLARGEGQPAPGGNEPGAQAGAAAGGELAPAKPKLGDVRTSQIEDSDEGKGWKEFYGSVYTERSPEELERMARGYGYPVSRNQHWANTGRMILSPEKDGSWAVRLAQVADQDRNLGVATEMYKRAIEYAKEQGATELTSDPEGGSKDNVAGIWRKLGAVETPGVGEKPGAVRWRLDLTKEQPAYQRAGKEVRPEDSFALPGMEGTDQARGAARGDAQAEELTERMKEPLGSIERAAGEMERNAPLFAGSEASGQGMLFGGTEEAAPGMLFQHQGKENPVARSVQDLIDALAKDPRNDDRTALQKVADFTGRKWDESTSRSAAALREAPSRLEQAWAKAKLLTASLVDGFRHPLEATDWKKSVGQMDLARAETAIKLRDLGRQLKDAAPDPLTRIGITHWIEAGGDPEKLDKWNELAKMRWELRQGDPDISPRLKNHLAESVEHYEAATKLTPEQKVLGMRIKQHLDDMLTVAKQEGLLEYGARNYVRHLYETADAADLVHLLDANELSPNPGFIERRIFQSYFEAENHGMIPRNKDVGYLVTAYDKSFNQALSSRAMMKSLLDGRGKDGRPLAAIKLRGKWVLTDEDERPLVLEQRERPDSLRGYKGLEHAPTRNFLFEPTMEDLDGYQYDPKLFEEDPARLAFKGDLIFHPEVAGRIDDMLSPGWFDRNETAPQKLGHALLRGSGAAKELMTLLAPFHLVQLAEHSAEHWVNPLSLPEIDLSGKGEDSRKQRLLASNGLGLVDFDAEGLFSAKTLKSLSAGIPGVNVAMDAIDSLSRWQFENVIPRMKMKMASTAFDRNWKNYGRKIEAEELANVRGLDRTGLGQGEIEKMAHERAERMVAELTAKQANAAFGNLNTAFDSLHRSKTFKQLLRLTMFAPDFLESRIRYTGQAFTKYGGEQRAALIRGALGMWVIARVANALINKGDTKNDLQHAFTIVAGGRNFSLRSQEGDILHLVTDPRSFAYSRINPLTTRPIIEYLSGRDQMGRQKSGAHVVTDTAKAVLPFSVQKIIQTPDEGWLNSILSSAGVVTSNYRSLAEEMTHKLFIKSLPDLPDDPQQEAQGRARHQLTEAVREGKKKPADVIEQAKEGKFTLRQAFDVIDRAGHSELYNEFSSGGVAIVPKHAGDPSALDIYARATPQERMELRPALINKGEDQLPELPRQAPAASADVRALEKEWDQQAKDDPTFKRPEKVPDTQFEVLAARWRALLASTPHEQGVPPAPGQQPQVSAEAQK